MKTAQKQPTNTHNERIAGRRALRELTTPIAKQLMFARVLAAVAGVLAIAPYIALVNLGNLLYSAHEGSTSVNTAEVWRIINFLVGSFGLRLFIVAVALGVAHFADIALASTIRQRAISRIAVAPLGWFSATNAGRIRKTLHDDIAHIHALIAHLPVDMTQAIITPVAMVVYAFVIDWRLGFLCLASVPVYAGINVWMMRDMGEKTVEMDARLAKVSATMVDFFTGITVVKAFGTVDREHRQYQDAADEFSTFYLAWVTPLLRGSALANASIAIPVLLAINLGGGALLVNAGLVSPIDVLAATLIALMLPATVEVMGAMNWSYQLAGAAALRVVQTLDAPTLTQTDEPGPAIPNSEVCYREVCFSYGEGAGEVRAVDKASFTLPEGGVTALVGPSGSGKSTLAMLLARFNDPSSGSITIGGVDTREIPTAELYKHVAFVLQDPQLLRISMRDNIALGKPDATLEEVRNAARAAQILEVIEALPNGFDTIYGSEHGLSGGQAQRVAIARAVLLDAPVLILDEATAFADPESEADIQKALSELVQGRTVLVIAHRPESIIGVDQIVVVDGGRVVAVGTHEELSTHPLYRHFWQHSTDHSADKEQQK